MTRLVRLLSRVAVVLSLALSTAAPASASYETFKRSMSNLLMFPLDLIAGPYVGMKSVIDNVSDVQDTTGVRVFYFLPGLGWNIGMQTGGACLRGISGGLEFVPGLFLIPFEADMTALFPLSDRQDALVDIDTRAFYFKFGVNYVD